VIPLVLLHGWGMTASAFEPLRTRLGAHCETRAIPLPGYRGTPACEPYGLQSIAQAVAQSAPQQCAVLGWSLGAHVALEWARIVPRQITRMVLIGATPCFTQREDWAQAMEPSVLQGFALDLASDRERTLDRFTSLQARGDSEMKAVTRTLRACAAGSMDASLATLQQGLKILSSTDLRGMLGEVAHEVLVVHGDRDALVPRAAGEYLATTLERANLRVIEGAAHAPFVAHADTVAAAIEAFLQ
jgi:pimeloyl-[acyl-carrier protein] methyl ester esterase